jgi:predicted nuclease of restriction endonuclease-like (RecB) superfamily
MAKAKSAPRKNMVLVPRGGTVPAVAKLATEIRDLIETARSHVSAAANLAMVDLYWNIGRIITQDIQKNEKRAAYGGQLMRQLSSVLTHDYGQGYSVKNLWDMKRFFGCFEIVQPVAGQSSSRAMVQPLAGQSQLEPICQTPSNKLSRREILQPVAAESTESTIRQPLAGKSLSGRTLPPAPVAPPERIVIDLRHHFRLGWTHYRMLLSISDPMQRRFYFEQAASQHWSKREFRRQIDRGLFERVALSRDIPQLVAQERKTGPAEIVRYEDIFKDPYVLDFLGLKGAYSEKDLEAAIVRNLEQFLTELGTDFCFIGRQYAMRIDEDDDFLDLLFYHRGLRCLVAIDLKIGTFTAADKGQMDLYLSWLKEHDWRKGENEPVGLILCTSARRQHVELLLRHGPHRMKVAEYLTRLPDKRLLEERLKMYSKLLMERRP